MENNNSDNSIIEAEANAQLRSAQTLITVAVIAGPVSLILGGVLLSVAALVCALVARSKVNRARIVKGDVGIVKSLGTQTIVALVVSIVATVLNFVSFAFMFMFIMDAINSGNLDQILDSVYGAGGMGSSAGTASDGSAGSVWD